MARHRTTVLAFGSFDILHPGHIAYLTQAKSLGDCLVVVIAKDATIARYKGKKPYLNERERAHMVSQLTMVEEALVGDLNNPYKVLLKVRPNVICLGYDQKLFVSGLREFVTKNKLSARIVTLQAHNPKKFKSTKIKLSMNH